MTFYHHEHSHGAPTTDEASALLQYMSAHNASHLHELEHLREDLAALGKDEAAAKLDAAIAAYRQGNAALNEALALA